MGCKSHRCAYHQRAAQISRFKALEEEANLTACTLNGRPAPRVLSGVKPGFLMMGSAHLFILMGA